MIDSGSPETLIRGPGKRPSATASRTAITVLVSPPRSRTVVNPRARHVQRMGQADGRP